ncbi:MAG TPA: DNA recombination protein RmuC [Candidatus Pacearchaeota archaeon]|nr:DNA recombination protein RmuC [Candidatus Parcubacteria bacterium]HNZ84052.1 DNA recombination protein RmuC [Candidatus Pacearchaeota archaeon]HOU45917.1 DNA recombination protein RmuC [Candidatus Pacearchaeota archaeon]HPM08210.1 DNA recombination protein RmuC [Candidatus Pacearchaeota archaeon]HQI74470.1 DNA recombination protein RmuC [Candidatus Pacearchaeota archaeon]
MTDILLILVLIALIILIVFNYKNNQKPQSESAVLLQQQLNSLNQVLDSKLSESNKNIQEQFRYSASVIKDITAELTTVKETNKQIAGFANQLQSLEDILKNTKQRGILGEYYLEEILKNVLPPSNFVMQYKFKDDKIVDAAIFVEKNKIIPIDSKFSLENYNKIIEEKDEAKREQLEKLFRQDLKNRIDETAQYIRPQEGTFDFAFMFIPSEAIYYDLLINKVGSIKSNTKDLIEYAIREKRVHIVSPTSFYAYLQTVAQGFRFLRIEQSTKIIIANVEKLKNHLQAYDEHFSRLGNNLETAVNAFNLAQSDFSKIEKDVTKITGAAPDFETKKINKPLSEE